MSTEKIEPATLIALIRNYPDDVYDVPVWMSHQLADAYEDREIALAQAVEFAEYVVGAAKGKMVERAERFLSTPYAKELAERLKRNSS